MEFTDLRSQRAAREIELERLGPQELLRLAHEHGINLLNRPFVIETILDEEFPELKSTEEAQIGDGLMVHWPA